MAKDRIQKLTEIRDKKLKLRDKLRAEVGEVNNKSKLKTKEDKYNFFLKSALINRAYSLELSIILVFSALL
ncbi:MAG: hypothetical protein ACI94Y_003305 [Maribacter sp.]|jgi:hypothetical protein